MFAEVGGEIGIFWRTQQIKIQYSAGNFVTVFAIIEQCRTGVTTIGRGPDVIPYDHSESHRA